MKCDRSSVRRKIGVFTIASKNYFAYVRVLLKSVARFNPDYRLFLCLADSVDGCFDASREPFELVQSDSIGIPFFEDMALRYDILEFNTAVKPFMFRWLLANTDLDSIIYVDPDICVYSRFDRLENILASDVSLVLTPHITRGYADEKSPDDHAVLQTGVFNLGFAAANRTPDAISFLDWWSNKLESQACAEPDHNMFTDQRWCDFAPCFVDRLHIFKDPGYNVAYWNLSERLLDQQGDNWYVNGKSLACFHFSGINLIDETVLSKHQSRFSWSDLPHLKPLFDQYRLAVNREGWEESSKWPYEYNKSSLGFPLARILRQMYRDKHKSPDSITGPQSPADEIFLLAHQQDDSSEFAGSEPLTRLMITIYTQRADLRRAFNLRSPDDRKLFIEWFRSVGISEYGLDPDFFSSDRNAISTNTEAPPSTQTSLVTVWRKLSKPAQSRVLRGLRVAVSRSDNDGPTDL